MKKLPGAVIREYRNKILNIHPALLPAFGGKGMYGHFVHEAVLAYGAKVSGVTVHLVDEEYDHGAIIMQRPVVVEEDDTPETLAARVLKVEHDTYWRAVRLFADGMVKIEDRKVIIL
jgi:phosphoribosylglycinamide formyltransferase-1